MKSYQDFRPMLRRTVRKSQGTMVAWDDLDDRLRPMVVAWDDHNDRLRRIVVAWDMMVAWDATGDIPFWGCLVSGDVLLRIVCDNCMYDMFRIHVWYNQKLDKYSSYLI